MTKGKTGDCPFYCLREYSDNPNGNFCELCGSLKRAHRTCLGKYSDDWHECDVFKRYGGAERLEQKKGLQSLSAASASSDTVPAEKFDYSGLDEQTVADLHLAEREYSSGRKLAEMGLRRMADGVAIAHDALCVTIATKCRNGEGAFTASENTFGRWCESIGLNRKAAERLLQVAKLMDESSPREQKVLEELSPSLLYAAAKPSAPAELVQGVKAGDITTHKRYQELLDEIRNRDAKISELIEASEASDRRADAAEKRAREAEAQCAAMLDKQDEHIAHIHDLESRPVEVAVQEPDPAELERMAEEKARALTAELRGQLKTAEGNLQRMKSIRDSLQSQLENRRQAAFRQAAVLTAENVLPMAQDLAGNIRALYNTFLLAAHGLHGEDYRRCAAPLAQALEEALGGLRANTAQYTANRYEEDEDFE